RRAVGHLHEEGMTGGVSGSIAMKKRLGLVLVVTAVMAFAPAPLPKPERRGRQPEINLETFQGTWRATDMKYTLGNNATRPDHWSFSHVRIVQDRWTFMFSGKEGNTFYLTIDPSKQPPWLTFYNDSTKNSIFGVALIRRRNGKVEVMYRWG